MQAAVEWSAFGTRKRLLESRRTRGEFHLAKVAIADVANNIQILLTMFQVRV